MTQVPDWVNINGSKVAAINNGVYGTKTLLTAGQDTFTAGFSEVGTNIIDEFFVQPGQVGGPIVGTGVGYSQAGGSITITSGTTANQEFLARSVGVYNQPCRLRFTTISSQRIINNNFAVILADLIGEQLSYTINSAVSVTVNVTGHSFTALNVGQFVFLGGITGAAGVPGRYAIASVVAGVSITFTVASWPASGSGTLTLFGRNHIKALYNGVTATNVAFDVQRNGWATGDTTANINTTASPGTLINIDHNGREVYLSDTLRASSTTPNYVSRASRAENIPDVLTPMYVFLWSYNGTTVPASTTTWALGHLSVEPFTSTPVFIEGNRIAGSITPLPVALQASTASVGNISTVSTVTGVTTVSTVSAVTASGTPTAPATPYAVSSAATTNGALILTGSSGLHAFFATNTGATAAFVKLYNKATAPTVGTDVPVMIIPVAAAVAGFPGVATLPIGHNGFRFALGLGIAITGGVADSDTTAVALNQVKVFLSRTV